MTAGEDEMPSQLRKQLVFAPFNRASYQRLILREQVNKLKDMDAKDRAQEARLKDGELKFGEDEHTNKRLEKNPDLEEGQCLKEEYGEPPPYYMGLPLEEFDKGIEEKTFIVLTRRLHRIHISRFSATPSGYLLFPWFPLRRLAVYVCTNQIFDFFILFTIIVNCICLAIPKLSDLNWLEMVFFGIYVAEMVVKVSARGLIFNKYTYLRDPWNWLDFIVITSGLASFTTYAETKSKTGVTQALRTFRVLRAVKTISIFPGLRTIVNAMLRAIKMLVEVVLMTIFCLLVFSLVSVQIYRGSMRQKCVFDPHKLINLREHHEPFHIFYRRMLHSSDNWELDRNGNYMLCGNATGAGKCGADYICQPNIGGNPDNGFMNFDNVFWSALITFQLMTIDFWENAYRKVLLTNGSVTVIFFIITVFFGSFYLLNLMLAVVTITYQEEAERTSREIECEKNAKRQRKQAVATFYNMTNLATKQNIWAKIIHENKSKEKVKETESPLEKLMRLRKILAKWKKVTTRSDMVVNPDSLPYFEGYATPDRTSLVVTQNALYTGMKWREFSKKRLKVRGKSTMDFLESRVDFLDVHKNSLVHTASTSSVDAMYVGRGKLMPKRTADNDSVVLPACTAPGIQFHEGSPHETPQNELTLPHDVTPSPTPSLVPRKRVALDPWKQSPVDPTAQSKHTIPTIKMSYLSPLRIGNNEDPGIRFHLQESSVDVPDDSGTKDGGTQRSRNKIETKDGRIDRSSDKSEPKDETKSSSSDKSEPKDETKSNSSDKCEPEDDSRNSNVNAGVGEGKVNQDDFSSIATSSYSQQAAEGTASNVSPRGVDRGGPERFKLAGLLLAQSAARMSFPSVVNRTMLHNLHTGAQGKEELAEEGRWTKMSNAVQLRCYECCPSFWGFLQERIGLIRIVLHSIVTDIFFDLFINFVIVVNTIVMSSEHHGMSDQTRLAIKVGSILFTIIFAVEAVLKIAGLGVRGYFSSSWNRFDFFVAVGSVVSCYLEAKDFKYNKAQFLRAFRLLRILKLSQVWPAMNSLLTIIGSALSALSQLTCILLIILYIFAIIGLHLFSKRYTVVNFPNGVPRWNFNDFFHSFMMMFRVLCGEWIEALWDCMKIREVNAGVCMLVFLPTLIFGNFISQRRVQELVLVPSEETSVHNTRSWFNNSKYGKKWMKFRTAVMKKVDNDIFEYIVLFVIIASSLAVAFEDYDFQQRGEGDYWRGVADDVNTFFMVSFLVEMLLRWIAFGIARYFTNAWTIIDFIVVVVSILSVVSRDTHMDIQSFRALLALRALRPLRVVSRIQGMKIVVNSLMRAIPAILNVFVVSLVFWLIFSVMGVQFFAGKFYKCIDYQKNKVNVTGKEECLKNPNYTWFNSNINFDHIGNGFLALFQVATFEGWMEVMHDAVDSTEVDQQPQREASFASYLYFVAFVICGSFFSLNLVIGVIIDNFNILKRKYEGSFLDAFLTLNQRNYYNTLKKMSLRKPQKIIAPPHYRFQKVFYELSVSDRFELILMGVVLLNMLAVAIEYYQYVQQCLWLEVMFTAEIGFTTFFALEALLKIVGLRQHYFTLPWNVYDFLVAVISIVNVSFRMTNVLYAEAHADGSKFKDHGILFSPTFLRLLRLFRVSRSLRIIKVAKGLRKVMWSLIISLPAIVNIMALLALFLFVYAVFGMFLFPNIKLTGVLTPMMNFRTVVNSYLMLLCLSTAAGWNDVLDALMIRPPFCNNTHHQLNSGIWLRANNGECGNSFAVPFMVSYIIITFLFIINLYIAVILENYQQAHQQEEVGVTEDDFDMFYAIWQRYDPHATQFIPYAMLSDFVADLEPPLGIEKPNEIALVSINLPILEGDRVHCLDILLALVKNVLADIEENEDMDQLRQQINNKFSIRFPNRTNMSIISTTIQRKKEDVAARTLQRAWQVFKTQQTIYSIMKLSVKDRLKSNSASVPRTTPTVEELGHNMARASHLYITKLFEHSDTQRDRTLRPTTSGRSGVSIEGEDSV